MTGVVVLIALLSFIATFPGNSVNNVRFTVAVVHVLGWIMTVARLRRPAIVVTAARILLGGPHVVQVVPLTRTIRTSSTEIPIDPDDDNRLVAPSSAQCQHVRSVATTRIQERTGNVGPVVLNEVRETLALLLDL